MTSGAEAGSSTPYSQGVDQLTHPKLRHGLNDGVGTPVRRPRALPLLTWPRRPKPETGQQRANPNKAAQGSRAAPGGKHPVGLPRGRGRGPCRAGGLIVSGRRKRRGQAGSLRGGPSSTEVRAVGAAGVSGRSGQALTVDRRVIKGRSRAALERQRKASMSSLQHSPPAVSPRAEHCASRRGASEGSRNPHRRRWQLMV